MGRCRVYASAAERVAACRARKKAAEEDRVRDVREFARSFRGLCDLEFASCLKTSLSWCRGMAGDSAFAKVLQNEYGRLEQEYFRLRYDEVTRKGRPSG